MSMKKPFVSEIAPKTYVINEYGLTAMYLCVGSERALLIDTGCGVCELKELVAELTDKPYDVVLTHGHLDHCGGIGAFEKVYANERDFDMIHNVNFEELRNYCDTLGNMGGYDAYAYSRDMVKEFTEFPELINVEDGFVFDLGDRSLKVVTIAGHTPGGLALLDEKNRLLISGDCCNTNTLGMGGSVNTMLRGFLKVQALSDKFDQNWNGHVGYAGLPTCFSQPESAIEDLIQCCKLVLEGKAEPVETIFLGRKTTGVNYGKVRMTYNPERLLDEGEEPVAY